MYGQENNLVAVCGYEIARGRTHSYNATVTIRRPSIGWQTLTWGGMTSPESGVRSPKQQGDDVPWPTCNLSSIFRKISVKKKKSLLG